MKFQLGARKMFAINSTHAGVLNDSVFIKCLGRILEEYPSMGSAFDIPLGNRRQLAK